MKLKQITRTHEAAALVCPTDANDIVYNVHIKLQPITALVWDWPEKSDHRQLRLHGQIRFFSFYEWGSRGRFINVGKPL